MIRTIFDALIHEKDFSNAGVVARKAAVILSLLSLWKVWLLNDGVYEFDEQIALRLGFVVLAIVLASWIYWRLHNFRWIAGCLVAMALPVIGVVGGWRLSIAVFAYGRDNPLVDAQLAAIDGWLGFDWPSVLRWWIGHPLLNTVARGAYDTLFYQLLTVPLILGLTGQPIRASILSTAATLGVIVTSVCAMLFPSYGAYEFFQITAADHPGLRLSHEAMMTAPIDALRAGLFDWTSPPRSGLISMPSFHAASAVYCGWACLRLPRPLAAIMLGLNALMLFATPIHGSHYLCDCIAGVVVAAGTLMVANILLRAPWAPWLPGAVRSLFGPQSATISQGLQDLARSAEPRFTSVPPPSPESR